MSAMYSLIDVILLFKKCRLSSSTSPPPSANTERAACWGWPEQSVCSCNGMQTWQLVRHCSLLRVVPRQALRHEVKLHALSVLSVAGSARQQTLVAP
eukprot:584722-Amphidinium_carterae.1